MAKRFRACSLDQSYLLPPSLHDWLPAPHLARFVADVVSELDLSALFCDYTRNGRGLAAYHPEMMVRVLLYAYCTSQPSSRKIEQATYTDLAFRFLAANQHPDHDTIAAFRQRHLTALASLFVQVLRLCQKAGLVKLRHVAIDGTKIKAMPGAAARSLVTVCASAKSIVKRRSTNCCAKPNGPIAPKTSNRPPSLWLRRLPTPKR